VIALFAQFKGYDNLLFIGQLDDLKCKIYTEGGILKTMRGNLVGMKVEKIMTNLYVLLGDMLQEADAIVVSTNQEVVMM